VEIVARMKDLQFANKTSDDVELMHRINEVSKLIEALEKLPGESPQKRSGLATCRKTDNR